MSSNAEVEFHSASIDFSPDAQNMLRAWLRRAFEGEGQNLVSLNYVFCSDAYLLNINQQFLNHDDFTDVITFDYGGEDGIAGEIYISVDRVKENAETFGVPFRDELHRVMIHGALHLCGYKDSKPEGKREMTEKEDYYLSLRTL